MYIYTVIDIKTRLTYALCSNKISQGVAVRAIDEAEQSDLDQRLQDVVKDFVASDLDAVLGNINVSGDIATKIRRTIDSLTASIAVASTAPSQAR